ncbi:carbon storage regulator [Novipirellula artificiosorum]|uniref:Translational regulator CsrA n=1 Tax=Novipirellula artificiosorum TaxID=2528016 RepID=A0A5C6DJM9_9BACT|nr:carbon storage regulator [Novipirellula artificiosorum]TWU37030.1 hypothetical protein Poly41_31560 [Novipirellula artificiosorum]
MLVLTRKLNEKIQIGENITITLIRVDGGKVRLGIDAPRDVRVLRAELEALAPSSSESAIQKGDSKFTVKDLHEAELLNEAMQIGEREEAFAHPVDLPNVSSARTARQSIAAAKVNRLGNLAEPRVFMSRLRTNDTVNTNDTVKPRAGAPLAAFLR